MWNYPKQIKIRYASFILAIILLLLGIFWQTSQNPEFLSRLGFKKFVTTLSINAEFQPLQTFVLLFSLSVLLMLLGVPSAIFFTPVLALRGFAAAFTFVLALQVLASVVSINLAKRSFAKGRQPDDTLANDLRKISSSPAAFAFWSRIYYSFPLRCIDSITPGTMPPEMPTKKLLPAIVPAIAFRLLFPSLWVDSVLRLLSSTGYNPQSDINMVLLWTSALFVYTVIPKIPEVFICPADIKKILYKLEETRTLFPAPAKTQEDTLEKQTIQQQRQKKDRLRSGNPQLAK